MDSSGVNRGGVNTSLKQSMQVHRLVSSKKVEQYQAKDADVASLPPFLRHVSTIWKSLGDTRALAKLSDLTNIRVSLQHIHDHFSSDQNPLVQRYSNNDAYEGFLDRIKPGGRFDRDLQEDKYDYNPNARRNTMKQTVHFFIELDKTSKVDPERALATIGFFPSPFEADYQCAGGMGSRLLQARSMLLNISDKVLLGPYQSIKDHLHSQLKGIVSEGDETHIPQALDALFGVPIEVIEKADPQFSVPFPKISSPNIWQSYRQSLQMGIEVAALIKAQARQAVMARMEDGSETSSVSITNSSAKMYLEPWGLSMEELYRTDLGLYDEMFLPNKREGENNAQFSERLSDVLALLMSQRLNQSLFDQDRSKYIPWLSLQPVDLTTIPDANDLLRDSGRQWMTAQINRGLTEASEPPELEVALNALLIMGERTNYNYPAMTLKVLHELGGEGATGIQHGLARLGQFKHKIPHCAHFANRIQAVSQHHLQGSYQEYGDFLAGHSSAPLLVMLKGGASREELCQSITLSQTRRLNEIDEHGNTPLFTATVMREVEVVGALVDQAGTMLNHRGFYGRTAVFVAAESGYNDVLQILAHKHSVNINQIDCYGRTPLIIAAEKGNTQAMAILINTGRCSLDAFDQAGRTALTSAVEYGHEAAVELLLSQPLIAVDHIDGGHRTPLLLAASMGYRDIVSRLLQYSTDEINIADRGGYTALLIASERGDYAMVNAFLACSNLNLNKADSDGHTPLMVAAENGQADVVEALLYHQTHRGQEALKVNAVNEYGFTALHSAASKDRAGVVGLLANNAEIDINSADNGGETALYWAAENNNRAVIAILAEHPRIDVNKANEVNMTPLWVAASNGHFECVQRLLESGADKHISDKSLYYMSPAQIAKLNLHYQVANLIASYSHPLPQVGAPRLDRNINPDAPPRDQGDSAAPPPGPGFGR
ncbi:MAG: ankyrin repeat protein [Cellvibrionaceae bacterium]|jgi:ankyrin repeat protein